MLATFESWRTTSTCGTSITSVSGVKSFAASYGSFITCGRDGVRVRRRQHHGVAVRAPPWRRSRRRWSSSRRCGSRPRPALPMSRPAWRRSGARRRRSRRPRRRRPGCATGATGKVCACAAVATSNPMQHDRSVLRIFFLLLNLCARSEARFHDFQDAALVDDAADERAVRLEREGRALREVAQLPRRRGRSRARRPRAPIRGCPAPGTRGSRWRPSCERTGAPWIRR